MTVEGIVKMNTRDGCVSLPERVRKRIRCGSDAKHTAAVSQKLPAGKLCACHVDLRQKLSGSSNPFL